MKNYHHVETVKTSNGISIINLNEEIENAIEHSRISEGFAIISSRHTTTAVCINECEVRLLADLKVWLNKLAPADDKYLHNDIDQRDCPPDEPENAHSHLAAMLLGSSELIALAEGELQLGQYQSVMLYELDGPRKRKVNVQVYGV